MRLDAKAMTWTLGILWGGAMLLAGLANLVYPAYAVDFLEWTASIYPGYHGPDGFGSVVVVTLYGFVDGAVCGFLLAWLYNRFAAGANSAVEAAGP